MTGQRVVLVHGLGSTFEHNWAEPGWVDLLEDEGFTVVPFTLPGHGRTPVAANPGEHAIDNLLHTIGDQGSVDAIGFSVGCRVLLAAALRRPDAFRSLSLLGIGDSLISGEADGLGEVPEQLGGRLDALNGDLLLIRRMSDALGNDVDGVVRFARSVTAVPDISPLEKESLPVLLVRGDMDGVGGVDRIRSSLPGARYVEIRRTDHLATPSSLRSQEAVLNFLGERG